MVCMLNHLAMVEFSSPKRQALYAIITPQYSIFIGPLFDPQG